MALNNGQPTVKAIYKDYLVDTFGNVYSAKRDKIIKLRKLNRVGYHCYSLSIDGVKYSKRANRLVAEAFIPNPKNLPYVCHENGNKIDNRVENLRWDTAKNNSLDRHKHGTIPDQKGSKNYAAKYNEKQIKLWRMLKQHFNWSNKKIAEIFKIPYPSVVCIVSKVNWKHI